MDNSIAVAAYLGGDAEACEEFLQPAVEPLGHGMNVLVEARFSIRADRRETRRHSGWVAVVRPTVLAIADRHEPVHDVAPTAERAEREAAADSLPERTQVRGNAEVLLGPPRTHAKGAEDFIEDQQDIVLAR